MSADEVTAQNWQVSTIYGARTRKGLVQIRVGDRRPWIVEPGQAHELAEMLHEAAAAALLDEFLMTFLQGEVKMPLEKAAQVLDAFRAFREEPES